MANDFPGLAMFTTPTTFNVQHDPTKENYEMLPCQPSAPHHNQMKSWCHDASSSLQRAPLREFQPEKNVHPSSSNSPVYHNHHYIDFGLPQPNYMETSLSVDTLPVTPPGTPNSAPVTPKSTSKITPGTAKRSAPGYDNSGLPETIVLPERYSIKVEEAIARNDIASARLQVNTSLDLDII